jgi:hypothetical protein
MKQEDATHLSVHAEGFTFVTVSTSLDDDASGEARRMKHLERRLALNNLCPAGYEVTHRQQMVKVKGPIFGDKVYDVTYAGRCRP